MKISFSGFNFLPWSPFSPIVLRKGITDTLEMLTETRAKITTHVSSLPRSRVVRHITCTTEWGFRTPCVIRGEKSVGIEC